jgi:hypothetical protein
MPRATVDQLWIVFPYITTAAARLLRTQAGGTGARSAFGPAFLLQQQTMGSPFECKKGYSISREFLGSTVLITGTRSLEGPDSSTESPPLPNPLTARVHPTFEGPGLPNTINEHVLAACALLR